ncbi:MAG: hypothetical protein HYY23_07505 [Verrucomicrobia bacterium]|nr:hypothetical protein [Verrucomicrobiota bacterium]
MKTDSSLRARLCRLAAGRLLPPHPGPLPWGEGGLVAALGEARGAGISCATAKHSPFHHLPYSPFSISSLLTLLTLFTFLTTSTCTSYAASLQTQTFNLHPGWNAIYLEVHPTNEAPSAVFGAVALQSLWTYAASGSTVEFIQNPNEPMANRSQWLMFVPTNRVESFQNSLQRVQGNRAYLVELTGTAPATLTITGTPSLRPVQWTTDGYTLRGLPVDPIRTPSFATFFSGSPAHYDSALRRLKPVYRLNATGQWTPVDADDKIAAGEAYWIFIQGASEFPGPVRIEVPLGDAVDFGTTTESITVRLANLSETNRTVRIEETGDPALNPLSYAAFDRFAGQQWRPLITTNSRAYIATLAPRQSHNLRLTVRRTELGDGGYSSALMISDGQGWRRFIPVVAQRLPTEAVALASASPSAGGLVRKSTLPGVTQVGANLAGLWFGSAVVTNVSEAHSGTLVTNRTQGVERLFIDRTPTPTASEFTLRLIVHVGTNGTARLLKEVIQMRTLPTYTNNAQGIRFVADPGHAVLVTDERLIPSLGGTALRAGQTVARRLSTADFDFPGAPEHNYIDFTGTFGLGRTVSAGITIDPSFPTNPFKHRYHPDHDNLTADFKQFKAEAYSIDRQLELAVASGPISGKTDPAYGYSRVEGEYRETVKGLHREPIMAAGSFSLRRISDVGVLNR